jgi:hypothetical protein
MATTASLTPEEKLKRVIDYVSAELARGITALEAAVDGVCKSCAASVAPDPVPAAAPQDRAKTEIARTVYELMGRLGRAEHSLRTAESACAERGARL